MRTSEDRHQQQIAGDLLTPHPVVLILAWACLTLAMQSLQTIALLLVGVSLMAAAMKLSAVRLYTLLRRTRWIMLSLLFIYAYATPGTAVWEQWGIFSPTYEGLLDGLLQLCRLAFALAGLAIVLALLSQQQLISGLYALAYPLRYFGLSRERVAVRLALTLHYAETAMLDTAADWRASVEHLLAPVAAGQHSVELHAIPFTLRDGLLLLASGTLLVLVLL